MSVLASYSEVGSLEQWMSTHHTTRHVGSIYHLVDSDYRYHLDSATKTADTKCNNRISCWRSRKIQIDGATSNDDDMCTSLVRKML